MSQLGAAATAERQGAPAAHRIRRTALPDEVLWNILEKLKRDKLEYTLFTSRRFRNVIDSGTNGPRRRVDVLSIRDDVEHRYTIIADNENQNRRVELDDPADVISIMKACIVDHFDISHITVDEALLQTVVALSSSWENGEVSVNCAFSSNTVFEGALKDALACRQLELHLDDDVKESVAVFTYPSVQNCKSLTLRGPMDTYFDANPGEVADWLNQPRNGNTELKSLSCGVSTNDVDESMPSVMLDLLQRFEHDAEPRPYRAALALDPAFADICVGFLNVRTSEYLLFTTEEAWDEPDDELMPYPLEPRYTTVVERDLL